MPTQTHVGTLIRYTELTLKTNEVLYHSLAIHPENIVLELEFILHDHFWMVLFEGLLDCIASFRELVFL